MFIPQDKLKILKYYDKYGLEAVQKSLSFQMYHKTNKPYTVSRKTIINWKKKYIESFDNKSLRTIITIRNSLTKIK
jgi:hypothetical protein